MLVGIISDTHDQVELIEQAVERFQGSGVELVYHLGDWCSPFTLAPFAELSCEVKGVFGNNDADIFKHLKVKPANVSFYDRFFVDTIDGKSIALLHGDPEELVLAVSESGRYDYLLRGHNHVAEIRRSERTTMINPGSLLGPTAQFPQWTEPSVAFLETDTAEIEIVSITSN